MTSRPTSTYQFPDLGDSMPATTLSAFSPSSRPATARPATAAPISSARQVPPRTRSRPDLRINTRRETTTVHTSRDNKPPVSMNSRPSRRLSISSIGGQVRSRSRSLLGWRRPSTSRHESVTIDSRSVPEPTSHSSLEISSETLSTRPDAVSVEADSESPATFDEPHHRRRFGHVIRRASVSIRDFVREVRHSPHPCDVPRAHRPATDLNNSWSQRIFGPKRSLAMQRFLSEDAPLPSPALPVPGRIGAPPIIPRKTGLAAKASAVMQNKMLQRGENLVSFSSKSSEIDKMQDLDGESGIELDAGDFASLRIDDNQSKIRDPMQYLPYELFEQIILYLDVRSLHHAAKVSRGWNTFMKNPYLWKTKLRAEFAEPFCSSSKILPGSGQGFPEELRDDLWKRAVCAKYFIDQAWEYPKSKAVIITLEGHLDSIYCLQFDEFKLITGSRDRTIRVWDMQTFECRMVIGSPNNAHAMQLINVTGGLSHVMRRTLPELPNSSCQTTASKPTVLVYNGMHDASVLCLQYDDSILVTGSSDNTLIMYDMMRQLRPIKTFEGHTAAVLDLSFDDKHIVSCSKDCNLIVWSRQGELLRRLSGHTGPVNSVQLRNNRIVSCSGDCTVKLWNLETGECLQTLKDNTRGLACTQFSDDGKVVISAGNDKEIRLWNAKTGEQTFHYTGHEGLVRALHLDCHTGRLISGSYDQRVLVKDLRNPNDPAKVYDTHKSWVLATASNYRYLISAGQSAQIRILDFGAFAGCADLLLSEQPRYMPWD